MRKLFHLSFSRCGRIDSITLIRRERALGGRRDLTIRRERALGDLTRSLDTMTWIRALGALGDTGENEGYGRECGRERTSILEDGLSDRRSSI